MASVQMMISANMAVPKIVLSGGLPARTRRSGIRDSPEAINRVDAGKSESLLTVPPVQNDTFMLFSSTRIKGRRGFEVFITAADLLWQHGVASEQAGAAVWITGTIQSG